MATRDTGSEQLIKDTARKIFFADGKMNATMQDIADAAGVARTLVNYYFRSKDILLKQVFDEAMKDTGTRLDAVLDSALPFRKKVEKFIDVFYAEFTAYPYKEAFMISEINANGFEHERVGVQHSMKNFLKEIQAEMDRGAIKQSKPANFMINLFSLMAHPLLTKPLSMRLFDLSEAQHDKLMNERKKMIVDMLFN